MKKITLKNIKQYIEGNTQMMLDQMGVKPNWYKEKIAYRMLLCKNCLEIGYCPHCGCKLPGRLYTDESCNNGNIFPDIMSEKDWEEFKKQNNIK